MAHRGKVFKEIDRRLQEYHICIENHIADESVEGEIDSRLNVPNPKVPVGIRKPGKVVEGSTTLVGITFRPKSFQSLWTALKNASRNGSPAFHYHALTRRGMVEQVFKDVMNLDLLQVSYGATKVGMPGEKEQKAFGFREVRELVPALDDRPLSMSDVRPDRRFSARFAPPAERKIDITSLHVALTPEACNVHIDDVGFVVRGPDGMIRMSPDFLQHLLNELVLKTYLRGVLGEWVTDHFSILVPSSDNGYSPSIGVSLDLPKQGITLSASFTFGCKCLPSNRVTVDERLIPIPEGWSVGVGLTMRHDVGGGR